MSAAVALAAAVGGLLLAPLPLLLAASSNAPQQGCSPGIVDEAESSGERPSGLDDTQLAHATTIVQEGRTRAVPSQGIVIALSVALQESALRVYANDGSGDLAPDQTGIAASLKIPHDAVGHDHGSLGLFQQQWPWWGTMPELMDPATSAGLYYDALMRVDAWESLPVTEAAQAVQRSAYPSAYADDEPLARILLAFLGAAEQCEHGGGGVVVMPLPAGSGYVDQRNFGASGGSWAAGHTGTDFSVACGTPVLAVHAGTVRIRTDQPWSGPWLVTVTVGPGMLTTWYAHLQKVTVRDGAQVSPGTVLGEVGAEGNSTGCHLHLEVHPTGGSIYKDPVNPSKWLEENLGRPLATGGYRVGSFNVLGASHSKPGGSKPWFPAGTSRMREAVGLLRQHNVSLVGLQELQSAQRRVLVRAAPDYELFHAPGDPQNAVAWRSADWVLADSRLVSVPYFDGHRRRMPLVRLQPRHGGAAVWVLNVHNPASTRRHPRQQRWRDQALRIEREVLTTLARTGERVLFTGDLNERHAAYCALAATQVLTSPAGGDHGGRCRPPTWRGIDWIFTSTSLVARNWQVDHSPQFRAVSDHPLVLATIHP